MELRFSGGLSVFLGIGFFGVFFCMSKKEPPIYANLSQSRSEPLAHFAATESSRLVLLSQPLGGTLDSRFGARRYMQNSFFCERRSARVTRCDWLIFVWIGGLFQIKQNSKKKYCGEDLLPPPCRAAFTSRSVARLSGVLPP